MKSSGVKFRVASAKSDLELIIELARNAHSESYFAEISFSEAKVKRIVTEAIEKPKTHCLFLASRNGDLVGIGGCIANEFYIGEGEFLTTIHTLAVKKAERARLDGGKAGLGLLEAIRRWSEIRNVKRILFHATAAIDIERTDGLMAKLGYDRLGTSFCLDLRNNRL